MSEGEIMIQSLLQEVSIQLNKISIYDTDEFIRKRYINLGTSYDMEPFVDIVGDYYHIKVCERRKVEYEYVTFNKRLAAYIILEDYTYRREWADLEDRFKYSGNAEVLIREIQSKYFKMFDNIYTQYFEKGISILNLESVACEEI